MPDGPSLANDAVGSKAASAAASSSFGMEGPLGSDDWRLQTPRADDIGCRGNAGVEDKVAEPVAKTSANCVVREATIDDVPGIVAVLADDTVGGHGNTTDPAALPAYLAAYVRIAASPNDILYVAEMEGDVVGTFQTTLTTVMSVHARPSMTIEAVHVRAAMRGSGIGAAMIRFAIGKARQADAHLVQLSSNRARVDAHRFYERLGFRQSHVAFKMKP